MANITCTNIIKSYGNVEVVHGFDLEVVDKEFIVFLGPSGCGKSTILRMIAGLEDITGGTLNIGEVDATNMPAGQRGVAMVFQNYALYPHMNVRNNIAFGLKRLKIPKAEIERRVLDVVRTLHLEDYLDRKPSQLSGGQQQRVAIARALIKTPDVFLFDEPLSNLDAKLRHQLREEIAHLHQKLETTTVYVTHDQLEAMALADRIVLLNDGNVEQIGSPRDIYNRPRTRFVADFIGTPPMNFIDGNLALDGDVVNFSSKNIDLTLSAKLFEDFTNGPVTLGIRPAHIKLSPKGKGKISGSVAYLEYIGSEVYLTVRIGDQEVVVVVPEAGCPEKGDKVSLTMPEEMVHLFANDLNLRRFDS